uniref:Uncharacterized protein n=1 Tax=Setaria italica TaxID=4555 RepID=K4ANI3_SETIT
MGNGHIHQMCGLHKRNLYLTLVDQMNAKLGKEFTLASFG